MLHCCVKKNISAVLMLFVSSFTFGQYLHLSNSYHNPISFIHTNAGSELRASQIGLVYRDQGNRIGNSHYKRIHFYGQRNLTNNFGIGLTFNNLTSGPEKFQYINANLTLPYHIRFSNNKQNRISIAPIGSFLQLRQNGYDFIFEESIFGGGSDVNIFNKQQVFQYGGSFATEFNFADLNIQFGYEYLSKANTSVGVLLHDLHKFLFKSSFKSIFPNADLNTTLLFQKSSNEHQLHILPSVRVTSDLKTFNAFDAGIGYRIHDGFTFLLGTEIYEKYHVYVNYDYTTSGLVALNNGNGAIELGLSYKFYKTIEIKEPKPSLALLPMKIELAIQKNVLKPYIYAVVELPPLERESPIIVQKTNSFNNEYEIINTNAESKSILDYNEVNILNSDQTNATSKADETIKETTSFLFYHDVNMVPIKSMSQKDLYNMIEYIKINREKIQSIEIVSYTDSKGANNYNIGISERRANGVKSVIKLYYSMEDKITWRGVGETSLTNDCYDGVDCIESKHNINRRTQVKINLK